MNYIKKINRGVIATAVILLAVIVYIVTLINIQEADKPKINDICKNYIQTEISYRMLPQKYRVNNPNMPKAEQDQYINEMTNNIKSYYPDDPQVYKYIIDGLKEDIEKQANGLQMVYDYKKEIISFDSYDFNNDSVTVNMRVNTSYNGYVYTPNPNSNPYQSTSNNEVYDVLTLKKINGDWKVIYSNLISNDGRATDEASIPAKNY